MVILCSSLLTYSMLWRHISRLCNLVVTSGGSVLILLMHDAESIFDNLDMRRPIFCHPVTLNSDILCWIAHLLIRHRELSKLSLCASLCRKTVPKKGSPCVLWQYNSAILRSVAGGKSVSWSIVKRSAVDENAALPCVRSCTVNQPPYNTFDLLTYSMEHSPS